MHVHCPDKGMTLCGRATGGISDGKEGGSCALGRPAVAGFVSVIADSGDGEVCAKVGDHSRLGEA